MSVSARTPSIATSSVEEGLDFGCNLLIGALEVAATSSSSDAQDILSSLVRYLRFRYVGELGLAFEELSALASELAPHVQRSELLNAQLTWVERSLQVESSNKSLERTREG